MQEWQIQKQSDKEIQNKSKGDLESIQKEDFSESIQKGEDQNQPKRKKFRINAEMIEKFWHDSEIIKNHF